MTGPPRRPLHVPLSWLRDRPLLVAAGGYVAVWALMLASFVVTAHVRGEHTMPHLIKADGLWYLRIAAHGYGPTPPIGPDGVYTHTTTLAFFPLYPALIRAMSLTGIPGMYAALLVTLLAGTLAALLIAWWALPLVGPRGAVVLTLLWSILPSSAVLVMAYSEALFVAAAAATLLALQHRRFLLAALACTVAGLTRPTAGALVVAVLLAIWLDARRDGLRRTHVLTALLAPAGLVASLAHVAVATGRVDGWFWLERTVWNSGFDGGWSLLLGVGQMLTGGPALHEVPTVVSTVVVVAFVAVAVVWLRGRPHPGDAAYVAVAGVLAIGERHFRHVKPRLLLVAFPVLVPTARRLAACRTPTLFALGLPLLAASIAWNTYLVDVWRKSL